MDPRLVLAAAAAAALLADQISKAAVLAVSHLPRGARSLLRPRVAAPPLAARWGLGAFALAAVWAGAALAAVLALSAGWVGTRPAQAGLGLALGGAAGNLVDLARRGGVVDFIELRFWPAFNLADVFIVAGLGVGLAAR